MARLRIHLTLPGSAGQLDSTPAGTFPAEGWYVFLADGQGRPVGGWGAGGPIAVDRGQCVLDGVVPGRYLVFAARYPAAGSIRPSYRPANDPGVSRLTLVEVPATAGTVQVILDHPTAPSPLSYTTTAPGTRPEPRVVVLPAVPFHGPAGADGPH